MEGRGPLAPEKSFSRLRTKLIIVPVFFASYALWNGVRAPRGIQPGNFISESERLDAFESATSVASEGLDVAARSLAEISINGTLFPIDGTSAATCVTAVREGKCVDGITEEVKRDRSSNSLMMVASGQVTTVGCPVCGEAICLKEEYRGYVVFYIMGMLYMFVGLAIVCDEFFVPALECFVDEFGISMDVAGATFMAAGGSMPELFTSFVSTFQKSEVGFAAIVGSAVFNVLFVIAVCAIASKETLCLTWYPLARDVSFYIVALLGVVLVFSITSPGEIDWLEALLLLSIYVCYCSFMKISGRVHDFLTGAAGQVYPAPEDGSQSPTGSQTPRGANVNNRHFGKPSSFRKGILQLLTQRAYIYETAGIAAVAAVRGNLEETFNELDADQSGYLDPEEIKALLARLGCKQDGNAIATAMRRITRTGDNKITFDVFSKWYTASEARIEIEVRRVFEMVDKDSNGVVDFEEISTLLRSLGHQPSSDEVNEALRALTKSDECKTGGLDGVVPNEESVRIVFEQFEEWYMNSMFWQKQKDNHEIEEEAENAYLTLDMPAHGGYRATFYWALAYPLCAMMYCTLPDVRHPKYQRNAKMAVCEFSLSLIWIGVFSNALFEWTVVASNTIGIPPAAAGVTILAAGTSIPDLLSSYIVAKHGEGDMAVSSSIGSNIFDVTVGLPLPWLFFNIIHGEPVQVGKDVSEVIVLIAMLVSVIAAIMAMKWKMTKALGYVMLVLYVIFMTYALLKKLPCGDPILKR